MFSTFLNGFLGFSPIPGSPNSSIQTEISYSVGTRKESEIYLNNYFFKKKSIKLPRSTKSVTQDPLVKGLAQIVLIDM